MIIKNETRITKIQATCGNVWILCSLVVLILINLFNIKSISSVITAIILTGILVVLILLSGNTKKRSNIEIAIGVINLIFKKKQSINNTKYTLKNDKVFKSGLYYVGYKINVTGIFNEETESRHFESLFTNLPVGISYSLKASKVKAEKHNQLSKLGLDIPVYNDLFEYSYNIILQGSNPKLLSVASEYIANSYLDVALLNSNELLGVISQ